VKALDFEVARGEVFGLLGPNGAGKSTTIGMLTTTIAPTSGTAALGGYDVRRHPLRARSVSSVVFQESVVDRGLTGRANLELHASLWGVDGATAAARVMDLAGSLCVADILDRQARTGPAQTIAGRPTRSRAGPSTQRWQTARFVSKQRSRPPLLLVGRSRSRGCASNARTGRRWRLVAG
jgi:ABC-type Fe3+/spermidine/putrescine transport system ATPase subunit